MFRFWYNMKWMCASIFILEAEKRMSQPVQSSQEPKSSQPLQPVSAPKKRNIFSRMSPRTHVILAVTVIAIAVVLAFLGVLGPREGGSDNVTGDMAVTPTVGITNLVDTVTINRNVEVGGLHLTVQKAMEATKFSDDRKRAGTYTVRVMAQAQNNASNPIGVQYDSSVRLVLPNGQTVAPKYISILPVTLPGNSQEGFFDFPISTKVPLSSLMLRFGNDATVAFSGS